MRLGQVVVSIEGGDNVVSVGGKREDIILNSYDLEFPFLVKHAALPFCLRKILSVEVRCGRLRLSLQVNVVGCILYSAGVGQGIDESAQLSEAHFLICRVVSGCELSKDVRVATLIDHYINIIGNIISTHISKQNPRIRQLKGYSVKLCL